MILLDTDHVSVLQHNDGEPFQRLNDRLRAVAAGEVLATSVVTFEEQTRAWLAAISKERLSRRQVAPYRRLARLADFYADFEIVEFSELAADQFDELRRLLPRVGRMDLKIAAIALVRAALVLTANVSDFGQVPNLRTANWLVP